MNLNRKLPLAFALVALLTQAFGAGGLWASAKALQMFEVDVAAHVAQERATAAMQSHFKTQVQEWKNVLLRGGDEALLNKHWKSFEHEEKAVVEDAERLKASLSEPQQRDLLDKFMLSQQKMAQSYRKGLAAFKDASFSAAAGDAAVKGIDREPSQLLNELQKLIATDSAAVAKEAVDRGHQAATWAMALMAGAALASLALGMVISRSIVGPLARAVDIAGAVAQGQLTQDIPVQGSDEIGRLMRALADMQSHLRQLVSSVRGNADHLASTSTQIAQSNHSMAQRSIQQAAAVQQTAASIEEMNQTVNQNADHSRHASDLAGQTRDVAEQGGTVVGEVVHTMKGINDASRRIVDIIGVIDGIAFQTNILALNAAVEAARAGEQGRGFAVVASEVRMLAQRSADAAREIKSLIGASVEQVERGAALADQAGAKMSEVVGRIREVTDVIGAISRAGLEQSEGVSQVGQAMHQMDRSSQENAAMVEQTSAAAQSLKHQADDLVRLIATFHV